jgi:hypothetical protein
MVGDVWGTLNLKTGTSDIHYVSRSCFKGPNLLETALII